MGRSTCLLTIKMWWPSLRNDWRAIPKFSDYEINPDGVVRRRVAKRGHSVGTVINITPDRKGYPRRALIADDGGYRLLSVHVAVLEAFVGPRPIGHDASHLNGVRSDCRLENLCWETSSANHQRKLQHGTLIHGEQHKCSKLKLEQVQEIRSRAARGDLKADLARHYNVSKTLVGKIVAGTAWMHAA